MDAVEYFKIKGRMCAAHEEVCDDCPLAIDCFSKELENPEEAVKIVNEWNEKHHRRTVEVEPLTDKEQRIFLAAMSREEKVCKQIHAEFSNDRESCEDSSLVRACHEIVRKVKDTLWT